MSDENQEPVEHGLAPSQSTWGTGIGIALAGLIVVFGPRFGMKPFTDVETLTLTGSLGALAGYIPKSGRKQK